MSTGYHVNFLDENWEVRKGDDECYVATTCYRYTSTTIFVVQISYGYTISTTVKRVYQCVDRSGLLATDFFRAIVSEYETVKDAFRGEPGVSW